MDNLKIKIDLQKRLQANDVAIEIGCGTKRLEDSIITVDEVDLQHVDIVADIENGLTFLPDASIDRIYCRSVLEHIDNLGLLLKEILRVLRKDGKVFIFVPHFSNPYYYSDYTHKRHFGLYTFFYFVEKHKQLKRKVPIFYSDIRIDILSIKLVFKTPFKLLKPLFKLWHYIVNCSAFTKELYEFHLSPIIPCYGIELIFKKAPPRQNLQ